MHVIYKYSLNNIVTEIRIPKGFEFLDLQMQNGKPTIWALVNTENEYITARFQIVATGEELQEAWFVEDPQEYWLYRGTVQDREFVWHIIQIWYKGELNNQEIRIPVFAKAQER